MSSIDDILIDTHAWISPRAVKYLAVVNALTHEVRPDGTSYVAHANDPGGATNYGISLRFLLGAERDDSDGDGWLDFDIDRDGDIDADDIRLLDIESAEDLYIEHFWEPYGIDQLPARLAVKVFDMAVNMGPRQAIKLMQRALNLFSGSDLTVDGVIGPITLEAAHAVAGQAALSKLMRAVRDQMTSFYEDLVAKKPKFSVFLRGWLRRASA